MELGDEALAHTIRTVSSVHIHVWNFDTYLLKAQGNAPHKL